VEKTSRLLKSSTQPAEAHLPPPETAYSYGPGDYDFTLDLEGTNRYYKVHVPPSYQMSPAPLVINFHGGGGNPDAAEEGIGGMNAKADQEGFIAVYPQGSRGVDQSEKINMYYWNAGKGVELDFIDYAVDDISFISRMLDKLEEDFAVDANRVYATGISNGAWMSYALACRLSDRVAAVAPVAGGLVTEDCSPSEPVSVIHFHGLQDPGWPYNGGGGCWTDSYRPPIQETIDAWLSLDGCEQEGRVIFQNTETICESYSCQAGTGLTFCTIADGGHTFPGGYQSILLHLVPWDEDCALGEGRGTGKVSQSISALDMMWEFFKNHPKSTINK
jgi:polyhydroxybutyrate depolymerase